jgi:hypothetical protein
MLRLGSLLVSLTIALLCVAPSFAQPAPDNPNLDVVAPPQGIEEDNPDADLTAPTVGIEELNPNLEVVPEFARPGTHTLVLDVSTFSARATNRRYTSICADSAEVIGPAGAFPGILTGHVGWGQAEIGWPASACMVFELQVAVQFDLSILDAIEDENVERAVLTYEEQEGVICPLVFFYHFECWQSGSGEPEDKPMGCAVVRIPSQDWVNGPGPGIIPALGDRPTVARISAREWDVTEPLRWEHEPGAIPLGGSGGFGFLLAAGLSLDQLDGDDKTVCVSRLSNVQLHLTYTLPPAGEFNDPD